MFGKTPFAVPDRKLMHQHLQTHGVAPAVMVTNTHRTNRSALAELGLTARHEQGTQTEQSRRTLRCFRAEVMDPWRAATAAA